MLAQRRKTDQMITQNGSRPILLVEDSADDAELTQIAFREANILNPIVWCTDGVYALDYLLHRDKYSHLDESDHPLLILLDIKMPRLDGFDVLAAIKEKPDLILIPVVVLTSSKEQEDILLSYQNGCNSYIRKPVNFGEFIEVIRQVGIYWLLTNIPSSQP